MKTKNTKREISRRDLLKDATFLGSTPLLTGGLISVFSGLAKAQHLTELDRGDHTYPNNLPENIIYSACLQCHTACPIKCKVVDGVLVKIDGNPYCPQSRIPNVPYASTLEAGASVEGRICPKGQAGIETLYDPYRILKVLKRKPGTPRGGGQWVTVDFHQAIDEIVNGGDLFGEGNVAGLKEIYAVQDRKVAKAMASDVKKIQNKEMTVAEFQAKHRKYLDTLIDPEHPDLGPQNNQFVFLAGRIEHGRKELMKWFTNDSFGSLNAVEHTTICEQSHHIAFEQMTNQWTNGSWSGGKTHMKPDLAAAEFVIFFGTGFSEANFGPPLLTQLVSDGIVNRGFKFACVDPRLSRSAGKADWWIPIRPGTDAAFALGMIRWMIENERLDRRFLENANRAAALADGETSWTAASYLVKLVEGRAEKYLRASELGIGSDKEFVVSKDGRLVAVDPYDDSRAIEGELEASARRRDIQAQSAFSLLTARVKEKTLEEYADICGVGAEVIVEMAREFTSHGKKAMAEFYRGPVQHTNGYYNAQALITLNLLIGNPDWKGGMAVGGGHWHEFGGKAGNPYDMAKLHPSKFPTFGVRSNREKAAYEKSTLFEGYPAKRPWYPFTGNLYQEVVPSANAAYPYPIKVLVLHKGTPAMSCPAGHKQIDILRDPAKIPLFIACDIVIGETSMYADYIFPDTSVWERWGTPHITPAMLTTVSKARQPAVAPLVRTTEVDGVQMPINLEALLIAVAKKLGLPGFGDAVFGPGRNFNHQDHWYLKLVANIAMGDKSGDTVPAADAKEIELFQKARRHLPSSVYDLERWKSAAGEEYWPHVAYVLNRGGRFEDSVKMHKGDKQAHPFKGLFLLYVEKVATTKNSMTGQYFEGLPLYERILFADGTPVVSNGGYPFHLITYKEIFGGHSRTMPGNLWLGELLHENAVLMNRQDAERLGLQDGNQVRLSSPTNPEGLLDLGNGESRRVQGKIRVLEGIRPGVVAVSWHFGHWAYGSRDAVVDGKIVKGDPERARGILPNPLMLEDTRVGQVCLTDPIGGSASFFDTPVNVLKL
ncbi:molybdopterin-dependent oxidoreductase [Acidobacteria bacterium AH-259-D05]|nr:molybdopterin-dependent oxidoreductase [Acidobacteria bacterium AH-259-D05]